MGVSLQIFMYFLALPSLLHPSILFNCFLLYDGIEGCVRDYQSKNQFLRLKKFSVSIAYLNRSETSQGTSSLVATVAKNCKATLADSIGLAACVKYVHSYEH